MNTLLPGHRSVIPSSPALHGLLAFIHSPSSRGRNRSNRRRGAGRVGRNDSTSAPTLVSPPVKAQARAASPRPATSRGRGSSCKAALIVGAPRNVIFWSAHASAVPLELVLGNDGRPSTDRLIPVITIGILIGFTLSQLGLVRPRGRDAVSSSRASCGFAAKVLRPDTQSPCPRRAMLRARGHGPLARARRAIRPDDRQKETSRAQTKQRSPGFPVCRGSRTTDFARQEQTV